MCEMLRSFICLWPSLNGRAHHPQSSRHFWSWQKGIGTWSSLGGWACVFKSKEVSDFFHFQTPEWLFAEFPNSIEICGNVYFGKSARIPLWKSLHISSWFEKQKVQIPNLVSMIDRTPSLRLFAIWTHFPLTAGSEAMPFSLSAKQRRNLYRERADVMKRHPRHGFCDSDLYSRFERQLQLQPMVQFGSSSKTRIAMLISTCGASNIRLGYDIMLSGMDVQNTVAFESFGATWRAMVCIDSLVWRLWALRAPKAWYSNVFRFDWSKIIGFFKSVIFLKIDLVGLDPFCYSPSRNFPSNPSFWKRLLWCASSWFAGHTKRIRQDGNSARNRTEYHKQNQTIQFKLKSWWFDSGPTYDSFLPPGNLLGWVLCWLGKLNNDDESLAVPEFQVWYRRPSTETS